MGEYMYSVWIEAVPTEVWDAYVDPTRIPEWQTGKPVIEGVRGDPGEPAPGFLPGVQEFARRHGIVWAPWPTRPRRT